MGFVTPTVLFAGVLVVAVLILWAATFALRRLRRKRRKPVRPVPTVASRWVLPQEPALPGIAAEEARLGDLEVRAVSIVGPESRREEPGRPRQDAYRLARDPLGQHLIIAVADGATAGMRPGVGAHYATTAVVAELRRRLDKGAALESLTAAEVFTGVAQSMVDGAQVRGIPVGSLYSTLVAMILPTSPAPDGRRSAWLGYLGNSSAWLSLGSGWQRLTEVSSRSVLLPFQADQATAALVDLPAHATVAVATDGLANAFTRLQDGPAHFAERWRRPPPIASFLLDVDLDDMGTEADRLRDDRTAVVVWCGAA